MRSRFLLGVVAVLALAGAATACQRPHQDPLTVHRAVLVGDSIAHGFFSVPGIGAYLPGDYPNASILGAGGGATGPLDGYDPATGTSNWSRELAGILRGGYDADVVVIQSYGRNYTSDAQWRAGLDAIVAAARADDPGGDRRVIMATTPRIVPGTSAYYEAAGIAAVIAPANAVMRAYPDVGLADIDAAWTVNGAPAWDVPWVGVTHWDDGFHLTDAGARDAARIVADA